MAQLQINLIEARNLKQKDAFSQNDTYVLIYLDDKKQQQKSQVKQNSNNPTWNQSFFLNHFQGQNTLHIEVYDRDPIKDENIGSVKIDLTDLYEKGQIDQWFEITSNLALATHGEIHLSLFYQKLQI